VLQNTLTFLARRLWPHGLTLALYAALTALALDNLVLHFATAIPESWDYAIYYWNLWWVKYALFTLHRDPMFTNYVLYPNTLNLSLHTHNLTWGLLTAPLQPLVQLFGAATRVDVLTESFGDDRYRQGRYYGGYYYLL